MNVSERESPYCCVCGKILTADEQRHTAPRCAPCEADWTDYHPDEEAPTR